MQNRRPHVARVVPPRLTLTLATAAALAAATLAPASLAAQTSPGAVSLSAGVMSFDASGTGYAPTVALRGEHGLAGQWLLGELSLGYASLGEQFEAIPTRLGVTEFQLQLQAPFRTVRPYIGAGGGAMTYLSNAADRGRTAGTVSFAAGARASLMRRFSVRVEARMRGWGGPCDGCTDLFTNSATELTAGISRSF